MATRNDELTQLLRLIALAAAPRASHIESEFFADPTLDPDLPEPEEKEYTDDDYARDVCQRRDGPL